MSQARVSRIVSVIGRADQARPHGAGGVDVVERLVAGLSDPQRNALVRADPGRNQPLAVDPHQVGVAVGRPPEQHATETKEKQQQ